MTAYTAPPGRFLARVEYLHEPGRAFARLRPSHQITDETWRPIPANDSRFLDDGLIFWWEPPKHASKGTLWIVTLTPQLHYGRDHKRRDQMQVDQAVRPYQAIAVHGAKGPRAFRRALASGRFAFEGQLIGQPLVHVVGMPGHWIPLSDGLSTTQEGFITWMNLPQPNGLFPVHHIDTSGFLPLLLDGQRYSLLADTGTPSGYQCVLSDAQLLEYVRKRISKLDSSALEALEVTKNLVRTYAETIEAAGLGGDEAIKEGAREDAIKTLITGLEAEWDVAKGLATELLSHPRLLESLGLDFGGIKREEPDHETAILALETERDNLRAECAAQRSEIATLRERPLKDGEEHHDHGGGDPDIAPTDSSLGALATLPSGDALKTAVTSWCHVGGLDLYTIQTALAALLSHPVTLVCGARAEAIAEALALTVAGDRAVRIVVGTAVFGPSDILCAPVAPLGGTVLPTECCSLGDFLATIGEDALSVVVLSGCNLAPVEVVLPDFLPALDERPRHLAWRCRDGHTHTCRLSPHVRLLATLTTGPSTHRVPQQLGTRLPIVPADHVELPGVGFAGADDPRPTRISMRLHETLRVTPKGLDIEELAHWLKDRVPGLSQPMAQRILSTYVVLLADAPRALAEAFAALLAGRPSDPTLEDLPGTHARAITDRLRELTDRPAWRAAAQHFELGDQS